MSWWQVIFLAVLQGLTEFLPISSSGHLAIASRVFFADDAGASFTAVSQIGTELAVLLYFARDIWRIAKAWVNGLVVKEKRDVDYRMGWYVIIGTIPIVICGLLFQDMIRTYVRSLWVVAIALVVFSAVIAAAPITSSAFSKVNDCGAVVLCSREGQLRLLSGASNTSRNGKRKLRRAKM